MHYIGTIPSKSHFSMQSALVAHFEHGGFYPIGGASEIAFNMIPVIGKYKYLFRFSKDIIDTIFTFKIERTGGKVLVKADVKEILHNGKKVHGVVVQKGQERYRIEAPIVISTAGIYNTFQRLLKPEIATKSYFR